LLGTDPFVFGRTEPVVGVIVYRPPTGVSQPADAGINDTETDINGIPVPVKQPAVSSAPPFRSKDTVNLFDTVDSHVLIEMLRGERPLPVSRGTA